MIDTHCHLTDPRLLEQLQAVVGRAAQAGVAKIVTIGTSPVDSRAAIDACGRFPAGNVRCAVGVHPNHVMEVRNDELPALRELQGHPAVVALGEMGLDYHYNTPRDRQRMVFETQLQLAQEVGRPVIIHSRESVDDCLAIMRNFPGVRAVFHCFTDTLDAARKVIDAGYLIGFTGPITYKKNDDLRGVVAHVPLDRMLVETDAPYLSPEPMRKVKTCEPAFVMHTAAVVAQVKSVSVGEVDQVTTANAASLFGLG